MKRIASVFLCLLACQTLSAQDTTIVQTLEFSDITKRRGWYMFPDTTASYRQVLMYYTLKCDPQTTQDGFDCGEWDYSTFTRLYEYENVGTPYYTMNGQNPDTVFYTNQPTYTYYQSWDYFSAHGTISENDYTIGSGVQDLDHALATSYVTSRAQYIFTATELIGAGVTAGEINKIRLDISTLGPQVNNLEIRMKHTTLTELTSDSYERDGLHTCYHFNTDILASGIHTFDFVWPFVWDGTSNVVVDLSFTNPNGVSDISVVGENTGFNSAVFQDRDEGYLSFQQPNYVEVPSSAFAALDSFITVSFWQYGDAAVQPSNSYAFEGRDTSGRRVINSHLPWSNSQVYWDAGNSGTNSYDRINTTANPQDFEGQWNHWAFVKDVSTGVMEVYLNGQPWHSGTNMTRTMGGIASFRIAAPATSPGRYDGFIDEFRVWDAALDSTTINDWMYRSVDATHPNYAELLFAYDFNDLSGLTAMDYSPNGMNGTLMGAPAWRDHKGADEFLNMDQAMQRPNITFVQGTYVTLIDSVLVLDSVMNPMSTITYQIPYIDTAVTGISYTDVDTLSGWEANIWTYTYDPDGNVVDSVFVNATDELYNQFYSITHQIQNYVTPYGIGIDLGPNGFRWVYDVTDYVLLLHDTVEISAGNQQELIDLKFVFIEGTPPRDIVDFETIWRGDWNHGQIADDIVLPAVDRTLNPDATMYRVKTRQTGHGFGSGNVNNCSEFCPKNFNLKVDGSQLFTWYNWMECSDNPVVDQGGTWIYDRAGWCPGTFALTFDHELTPHVSPGQTVSLDYGMEAYDPGGGQGNYRLTMQLVSYGDPNFTLDAAITDVLAPTDWEFHNRQNPICGQPIIKIRNEGTDTLTSVDIVYNVAGGLPSTYQWTGSLAFLEEEVVYLHPVGDWFWISPTNSKRFEVRLENANGGTDEQPDNDAYYTHYEAPDVLPEDFYVWIQSNGAGHENAYYLMTYDGDTLFSRVGWDNYEEYRDTFNLTPGCYTLHFTDSDEDGMSFFANSDGNGYLRWRPVFGGSIYNFENGFGDELIYHFTVGGTLHGDELDEQVYLGVYPNPSTDIFNVEVEGVHGDLTIEVFNAQGQRVYSGTRNGVIAGTRLELDLTDFETGIYLLRVSDGKVDAVKQIMKH